MSLEVLNGALMLLRGYAGGKRAKIAASAGPWILLARIKPVLAGG
jgi:hypothetical protein